MHTFHSLSILVQHVFNLSKQCHQPTDCPVHLSVCLYCIYCRTSCTSSILGVHNCIFQFHVRFLKTESILLLWHCLNVSKGNFQVCCSNVFFTYNVAYCISSKDRVNIVWMLFWSQFVFKRLMDGPVAWEPTLHNTHELAACICHCDGSEDWALEMIVIRLQTTSRLDISINSEEQKKANSYFNFMKGRLVIDIS